MPFAQRRSARGSGEVHKRTSACPGMFFPARAAGVYASANALHREETQDRHPVDWQACCEAFRCTCQTPRDYWFYLSEQSVASATDHINRELTPEQRYRSRPRWPGATDCLPI